MILPAHKYFIADIEEAYNVKTMVEMYATSETVYTV